jgi:hypothetical protein
MATSKVGSINIWYRIALSSGNLDIEDARMESKDIYFNKEEGF